MNHPTLLFLGGIGDQILATPALRALSRALHGKLCLAVAGGRPHVWSDIQCAQYFGLSWDGERLSCPEQLRTKLLISLTSWPNEPALRRLIEDLDRPRSIGFFPFYDEAVAFEQDSHMVDKYFAVAQHLFPGLRRNDYDAAPTFPRSLDREVDRRLLALRRPERRLLFFHPETKPEKCWTAENWSALLTAFLSAHGDYDVLSISASPYSLELGQFAGRVIPFHQPLPIAISAFRHADLFVGVDSCFLHAADAYRVPGLALFGPTEPRAWGFCRTPHFRHVQGESTTLASIVPGEVSEALFSLAKESLAYGEYAIGETRRESA